MALQQNLGLKLSQNILMTADLQQSIKLLQMSALELQEFVDNEILENPCLKSSEEESEVEIDTAKLDEEDHTYDVSAEDLYEPESHYEESYHKQDSEYNFENFVSKEQTLPDVLLEQLAMVKELSMKDEFLCKYLINSVSESGYINIDLKEEAGILKSTPEDLEKCIKIIQTFAPEGVGARNLQECLTIQAKYKGILDNKLSLLLDNLNILAKRDLKKLKKIMSVDNEELKELIERIKKLNPKPGLAYSSSRGLDVVPDIIITKDENGKLKVELNSSSLPKVALNNIYSKNDFSKRDEKKFIREKSNRANWLIKSIQQRQETIYKTAQALLKQQSNFFLFGPEGLQPLTLRQIAEEIGVHESTVSRISNEKFIQTEYGVFPLKYFFSSGVNSMGGQMVGAEAVKSMIRRIIDSENDQKPYSDEKLVSLLQDQGVELARRTVAKYRESLCIPSSSKRRVRI